VSDEQIRYARSPTALWRRVGAEVLVAAPEGSEVDRLSLPASATWLFLERPRTAAALTRLLADEFPVPNEQIGERVRALLLELESGGWLVRSSENPAGGGDE
jgi:hypothetical protein